MADGAQLSGRSGYKGDSAVLKSLKRERSELLFLDSQISIIQHLQQGLKWIKALLGRGCALAHATLSHFSFTELESGPNKSKLIQQ